MCLCICGRECEPSTHSPSRNRGQGPPQPRDQPRLPSSRGIPRVRALSRVPRRVSATRSPALFCIKRHIFIDLLATSVYVYPTQDAGLARRGDHLDRRHLAKHLLSCLSSGAEWMQPPRPSPLSFFSLSLSVIPWPEG